MAKRDKSTRVESLAPEMDRAFSEAAADYVASYYAGSVSRQLPAPPGVAAGGSGADYHYRNETQFLRMMERARYFDRDNMVVGQGVNRLVSNVVQGGYTAAPDTGDKGLDAELAARWWEWAESAEQVDYEGELTWSEAEALTLRSAIVDGDISALLTSAGSIQFVEAHRVRNPWGSSSSVRSGSMVHGVEIGEGRKRVAFWVTEEEIDPLRALSSVNRSRRIETRDAAGYRQVCQFYLPKRFRQTRGVTAFAPSVVPIAYHDDLQFASLLKAKAASFIGLFREYAVDAPSVGSSRRKGSRETETQGDGTSRTYEKSGLVAEVIGEPGEKLVGYSPNIPNPEFFPHVAIVLTMVSINLDLPLAVFLLDPSKTNFSGWRGAIDQARGRFKQIQSQQIARFHRPVYVWKVRQWAASDPAIAAAGLRSGVRLLSHVWRPPRWPYIEPVKDAQADDLRITRNLAAARTVFGERGADYEDERAAIIADRVAIVRAAIVATNELNAEFPEAEVSWREIAYGQPAQAASMETAIAARETAENTEPAEPAGPAEGEGD